MLLRSAALAAALLIPIPAFAEVTCDQLWQQTLVLDSVFTRLGGAALQLIELHDTLSASGDMSGATADRITREAIEPLVAAVAESQDEIAEAVQRYHSVCLN